MGKQIQVAMLDDDEAEFLAFVREGARIQLLRGFAPTAEQLFVESIGARSEGEWQYYVWNKAFPWEPQFSFVSADAPVTERRGWAYVSNTSTAPLVEFSRHNFDSQGVQGRMYWAKFFAAPNGLGYDVDAFGRWYDSLAYWIRRRGRRASPGGLLYLPSAWKKHGSVAIK
jgi:hypothetical protein